jgi:hypothetical protein
MVQAINLITAPTTPYLNMDPSNDLYGNTVDQDTLQGGDEYAQQMTDSANNATGDMTGAFVPTAEGRQVIKRYPDGSADLTGGIHYNPNTRTMHWDDGGMRLTYSEGMEKPMARPIPRPMVNQVTGELMDVSDPSNIKMLKVPTANEGKPITQEDFNKLSPSDQNKAQMYAELRLPISPYGISRDKEFNRLLPYSTFINPNLNAQDYKIQQNVKTQYASNKQTDAGGQIRSFNQAITHLGTLDQLADSMQNSWSPGYNSVRQWLQTQAGQPYKKAYDEASLIVATEMARAYKGGVPDVDDRRKQQEALDSANSPQQFKAVIRQVIPEMVGGALENLDSGWEKTMGKPMNDKNLIFPPARTSLIRMGVTNFAGRDLSKYGENAPANYSQSPMSQGIAPKPATPAQAPVSQFVDWAKANPSDSRAQVILRNMNRIQPQQPPPQNAGPPGPTPAPAATGLPDPNSAL